MMTKILLILLIIISPCYAQSTETTSEIAEQEEADSRDRILLKQSLRYTERRLNDLENGISLTTGVSGILPLANGGTAVAYTDPGADRIFFWDDSEGAFGSLIIGTNLTLTTMTLDADTQAGAGDYFGTDSSVIVAFDYGVHAVDLSSSRNVVSLTNLSDADVVACKINNCYDYVTDEYATIADNTNYDGASALTYEAWFYKDTTGDMRIFNDVAAQLDLTIGNTAINFTIQTDSGPEQASAVSHGLASNGTGAWVYIVIAWDNSDKAEVYINGVDIGDGDNAGNGITTSVGAINIGTDNDNNANFWDGKIDGFRILRRKMSAAEVLIRYNAFN